MCDEIWKPIPNWELYEISTLGNVRRDRRPVQPHTRGQGYLGLDFCVNSQRYSTYVHLQVLRTFVGERPKGYETRHKNGHKTDNRLVNLEYGTSTENKADSIRLDIIPRENRHYRTILNRQQVEEIRLKWSRTPRPTQKQLANEYGVKRETISGIVRGARWK